MARETDGRTDGRTDGQTGKQGRRTERENLETEEYREISNLADDYHSESV